MYPSLTFSNFRLPCFLKSLSLTPKFAAPAATPDQRLRRLNNLVSAPTFLNPCNIFSLARVYLICFSQILRFECGFAVIIPIPAGNYMFKVNNRNTRTRV